MHRDRPFARKRQRGIGMIDVLVAIVVFALGMSALAALYIRESPAPYQNSNVLQAQASANALFSILMAHSAMLPVQVTAVNAVGNMPSALQPWFAQTAAQFPGLTVSIASGPDAMGNACSTTSCGITATLDWTQLGQTRSQVFSGQIGIH